MGETPACAARVKPEVYRTSNLRKYCWVRFDTRLLHGIGDEGGGYLDDVNNNETDILTKNGMRLNVKNTCFLHYAPAYGNFTNSLKDRNFIRENPEVQKAQKERDAPAILFIFSSRKEETCAKTAEALTAAGVSVIEKREGGEDPYLIADARGIRWFAFNCV